MVADFRLRPREFGSQTALLDRLNAIFDEISRRIGGAEARVGSVAELEAALREYGTERVNAALVPVLASIAAAADLGAILTARSETPMTVGTGVKALFIAETARQAFAPAIDLSIVSEADSSVAMLGRRLSYNKTTGELAVDVSALSGSGSHGPWIVSPTASVETAGQVRTAARGELQGVTLAAQLQEIADALAARQDADPTLSALAGLTLESGKLFATDSNGDPVLRALSTFILDFLAKPNASDARGAIGAAPLNSPSFTGAPKAPTAQITEDTTDIANVTAVRGAIATLSSLRVQTDILTATTAGIQPPSWAKAVKITLIGGGGGGGSGRRGAATDDRFGGGGGAPGAITTEEFRVAELTWPITITIGAPGAGGVARTTNSTSGANGGAGGLSFVTSGGVSVIEAQGGPGGKAGATFPENPAVQLYSEDRPGSEYTFVPQGGLSDVSATPVMAPSMLFGPSGGGAGAGIANGGAAAGGGRPGSASIRSGTGRFSPSPSGVGAGANGAAGVAKQWERGAGTGGGGAGSGNAAGTTPGGTGGAGGAPGGGGGGGGASTNGANSGPGGAGARGEAWVTWYG